MLTSSSFEYSASVESQADGILVSNDRLDSKISCSKVFLCKNGTKGPCRMCRHVTVLEEIIYYLKDEGKIGIWSIKKH